MTEFNTELEPWEKEIVDKYPLIYREPNPEMTLWTKDLTSSLNFSNLRYGFEFQSGWAGLVDEFSGVAQKLVTHLRESGTQPDAYICACIFKEKIGRLTWQGDDNLIEPFRALFWAYTRVIEGRSTTICEVTGEPGALCVRGGWYKTLSYEKAREQGYKACNESTEAYWKEKDLKNALDANLDTVSEAL